MAGFIKRSRKPTDNRIKNKKKKCSKLVVYNSNILKSMMFLSTNKNQLFNAIKNKSTLKNCKVSSNISNKNLQNLPRKNFI